LPAPDAAEFFAGDYAGPGSMDDHHFGFGLDLLLDRIERLNTKSDNGPGVH